MHVKQAHGGQDVPGAQLPLVFILPYFLFSATAGQIADVMDKAKLVRWARAVKSS